MQTGALPHSLASEAARQWLGSRASLDELHFNTRLHEDLGIDSIAWMELAMLIREASGLEIRDEALAETETVADLFQQIAKARHGRRTESWTSPVEFPTAALGDAASFWLSPLGPLERWGGSCLYALNRTLVRLCVRLEVSGREHVPRDEQVVFVPQHTSYLDGPALGAVLENDVLRRTSWAVFAGVFFDPVSRYARRLTHIIPVDGARGARKSLAYGAAVLQAGQNLVWFPEGRLSEDGQVQSLKPGLGMLLAQYPVPVILVRIEGTRQALPPGHRFPRFGTVRITFRPQLDPLDLERTGQRCTSHSRITHALHQQMSTFCS